MICGTYRRTPGTENLLGVCMVGSGAAVAQVEGGGARSGLSM